MIASVFIIVFCSALLIFWLRATSVLLLREASANEESHFQEVFAAIREDAVTGAPLRDAYDVLEREARILTYLLKQGSALKPVHWEERLLIWDYSLMRCCFSVSRVAFPAPARTALVQMTEVLSVLESRFARRIGVC